MPKNVLIGPTVRSGGSLVARLFDHHPDVASYPFEPRLPPDATLHTSLLRRGQREDICAFPRISPSATPDEVMDATLLSREQERCSVGRYFASGKLKAKTSYLDVDASYDHATFLTRFQEHLRDRRELAHVYNAIHHAFFETWDEGVHGGSMDVVAYHNGNALFADIDTFFAEFDDAFFINPIRSPFGSVASEKKKIVRQLLGRGRIGRRIALPDRWLRFYHGEYFERTLVNWLITFTRAVVLQRRHPERYLVYRHEDLVRQPEVVMRALCSRIDLPFSKELLTPTVAGRAWAGNSMFGVQRGLNTKLTEVRDVFNRTERDLISTHAGQILDFLEREEDALLDFSSIDETILFDYDSQMEFYPDRQKTVLYFASMYERWKSRSIYSSWKQNLRGDPLPYFLSAVRSGGHSGSGGS